MPRERRPRVLTLSLLGLGCAAFSSERGNGTAADLERQQRTLADVPPALLVYLQASKVIGSQKPSQEELCKGLMELAKKAEDGDYAEASWGLVALREAQLQETCQDTAGLPLTAEALAVGSKPWAAQEPEQLALGAFGFANKETQKAFEELDREAEWDEARQKHALRDMKRVNEAFAWDNDIADIHPEDDALARWAVGKRYEDAMPDSRLRVQMQKVLGAQTQDTVLGSRSYAHDVEYGPPMDRSELVSKHANLARVVLLCRDDVWASLPFSDGLLLPSSSEKSAAARALIRKALEHFKRFKLDLLTEEGELWWSRWAAIWDKQDMDSGAVTLVDAGDTPARFDNMRELEIGKIWLERMLDALGSRVRGEACCEWAVVKELLKKAWGTREEKDRWLTRVEERAEHERAEEAYRVMKHERALVVERYRTMMRQLRDNRRFMEEERQKLVRLGYLLETDGVGAANGAGLTQGVTQKDLDERWKEELGKLHSVEMQYMLVAPTVLGSEDGPCSGDGKKTEACTARFRPWVERGYGYPKEWIQGSERDPEAEMIKKPIASSGGWAPPPRFSRAAGEGTARFGAFPPTESHPEYGNNYDPEDYYRPYYTSGKGDAAHNYVPHGQHGTAVLY